METNKTTKNEPKKLRHISLHATTSPQLKTSEEPRRREHEIRPLGGVVKVCFFLLFRSEKRFFQPYHYIRVSKQSRRQRLKTRLQKRFLSRNSMQFLSRWSCNHLWFHCNFNAVLVQFVSAKRRCTTISLRLLKSETTTQSHLVSWVASQTAVINCTKIAPEITAGLHARFWSCNFSATKIALNYTINSPV